MIRFFKKAGKTEVKKVISILLILTLLFTVVPQETYAAGTGAASGSTEKIDDNIEETVNADVYFVHSATKKLITLNGSTEENNRQIDCNASYDANNVPKNAQFKAYYGTWEEKSVINFTCYGTQTSWAANADGVYQIAKRTNPSGWESVQMEAQGDGTVSFKNNQNNKYITVADTKLAITDDEKASGNEKFIIYTKTAPKSVKKVTLSDVTGDTVNVSWYGVNECLYCGYEVMYSTSENGTYTAVGQTAETTYTVSGLDLNTKYYFKVRTLTNNENGPYKDSAIAYTTTLKDYRPLAPKNVKISENKDGSIKVNWNKSKSAKRYEIYRAESRFAQYNKIGTVGDVTSYTDANPNSSRYKNYYKIKAINDVDKSSLSEPASIEINMFGEGMYVFADTDDSQEIDKVVSDVFENQHYNQFGNERFTFAFKPGDYTKTEPINMGYYTQLIGLGKTPYDVSLNNVKTPAALSGNNVTCNFWTTIENVTIKDLENNDGDAYYNFQWAVSQAAPARRLNVERQAVFQWYWGDTAWASGGFVADSNFHKPCGSYSQQQYYYRNCHASQGTYGVNWNNVIQGTTGVTADNTSDNSGKKLSEAVSLINNNGITNWDQRGCTTIIDETPKVREKPFLYFDTSTDSYNVFVPSIRENSTGISWSENDMGKGISISVDKYFYIANPDTDTAETINRQLSLGKNILFTPGIYHVSEPIKVEKANTVILGLGLATIIPDNKETAISVKDVGGVSISGLILDAGNYSKTLLTVGKEGSNKDHSDNPITLQDIFYRVGGTGHLGRTDSCVIINSNDTIVDHTWIWRADHGDNTGWTQNTAKNGIIVNGDNVTAYGLFCEHFQEYDIIWRGENGTTYFLQNEKCYDPQDQKGWMSHNGTKNGYASYKVTNNVKKHYAVGLGIYDVFINTNGASIYLDNAIEVPNTSGVLIENACIVEIANGSGPKVGIYHIVNNTTAGIRTGEGNNGGYAIQRLLSYRNFESLSLNDYYQNSSIAEKIEAEGESPTKDVFADKDIVKENKTKDNETPLDDMTDDLFDKKIEDAKKDLPDDKKPDNPKDDNGKKPGNNGKTSDNKVKKLKKNQKFVSGKFTYKITKLTGKKGNVQIVNVRKKYRKKLKKATIKSTVKYKGYKFKITSIGKKAFAKSKKLKKITIKGKNIKKVAKNAFYKKVRRKLKISAKKKVKRIVLKSLKRRK